MKKTLAIAAAMIAATTATANADACMLDATSWLCEQQQMQQTGQANIFKPGSFMHQDVQRQRNGQQYGTNIFAPGTMLYNQHENDALRQHQQQLNQSMQAQQQLDYSGGCKSKAGSVVAGFLTGIGGPFAGVGQTMCR